MLYRHSLTEYEDEKDSTFGRDKMCPLGNAAKLY